MAVTTNWTDPSTGGALDLGVDDVLPETVWDALLSNIKHRGGVAGTNAVVARKTVDQSLTTGVLTTLTWDDERFDTNGLHSTTTNNSRLTCVEDGIYVVCGNACWAINSNGYRELRLALNGTDVAIVGHFAAATVQDGDAILDLLSLVAGDYVELKAAHSAGVTLAVDRLFSMFAMARLGKT